MRTLSYLEVQQVSQIESHTMNLKATIFFKNSTKQTFPGSGATANMLIYNSKYVTMYGRKKKKKNKPNASAKVMWKIDFKQHTAVPEIPVVIYWANLKCY